MVWASDPVREVTNINSQFEVGDEREKLRILGGEKQQTFTLVELP